VSESGYRRINAAIPPAWRERDEERPGLHKSAADAMGLDTTVSPIPIASDRLVAHAWGMTSEGPCFVYAERGDGQPRVYAVRFLRIGLEDMGIDPRRSLEEQIVRDALDNAAAVFAHALSSYAEEHEGRLPTHVGGPGLEAALQPYLHDPHALRALYEPDKVSARLLKPGALLSELGGPPGHKQPEPVAEIQEGDVTFLVVAERSPAFGPHEEESGRPSIVVSLRAMCSEDSG
jgi:hypothetical protein